MALLGARTVSKMKLNSLNLSVVTSGLILGNPNETLGDPSDGQEQLVANERYWKKIHEIFELWKDYDSEGPLS